MLMNIIIWGVRIIEDSDNRGSDNRGSDNRGSDNRGCTVFSLIQVYSIRSIRNLISNRRQTVETFCNCGSPG